MPGKLLTEQHLEFLFLKGGCTASLGSNHFKMPHCWKSHVKAHTVSHFSYAPLFQGPRFLTKMLESNILYGHFISLMTSNKYRNHSCESFCYVKDNFDKNYTCNLNVYIFYLSFELGIIHGDRCDRKTPETIILFK